MFSVVLVGGWSISPCQLPSLPPDAGHWRWATPVLLHLLPHIHAHDPFPCDMSRISIVITVFVYHEILSGTKGAYCISEAIIFLHPLPYARPFSCDMCRTITHEISYDRSIREKGSYLPLLPAALLFDPLRIRVQTIFRLLYDRHHHNRAKRRVIRQVLDHGGGSSTSMFIQTKPRNIHLLIELMDSGKKFAF